MTIEIKNNGPEILHTNFWSTEYSKDKYLLSPNAGCFRLLVPRNLEHAIKEMKECDYAIISTIKDPSLGKLSLEILFEDHSDNPYCLFMCLGSVFGPFPTFDQQL